MKHAAALIILALSLSACAGGRDLTCERLNEAPVQVIYPDGADRKSDIYKCSDGTWHIFNMDRQTWFTSDYAPQIKEAP